LTLGSNGADNANAWAQAAADKTKVNDITLTYASEVFIKSVTVRHNSVNFIELIDSITQ
jgi:hypothetical protein